METVQQGSNRSFSKGRHSAHLAHSYWTDVSSNRALNLLPVQRSPYPKCGTFHSQCHSLTCVKNTRLNTEHVTATPPFPTRSSPRHYSSPSLHTQLIFYPPPSRGSRSPSCHRLLCASSWYQHPSTAIPSFTRYSYIKTIPHAYYTTLRRGANSCMHACISSPPVLPHNNILRFVVSPSGGRPPPRCLPSVRVCVRAKACVRSTQHATDQTAPSAVACLPHACLRACLCSRTPHHHPSHTVSRMSTLPTIYIYALHQMKQNKLTQQAQALALLTRETRTIFLQFGIRPRTVQVLLAYPIHHNPPSTNFNTLPFYLYCTPHPARPRTLLLYSLS